MSAIKAFLLRENVIRATYILCSIVIGVQHYVGGPAKYNNFVIFRQSFFHLLAGKNLHLPYPEEYHDIFLYHPTFAVLFAPFSIMPVLPSLTLWLVGCALLMFYAIRSLPISFDQKVFFWWFVLVELVTALHGQQTNPIIAALGLFTYTFLEKKNAKWASLFPVLAFCIKGYGLIFAAMFLFYPRRRQYILYMLLWAAILAIIPLGVTGFSQFAQVYRDWIACLIDDHRINFGFSIMGLIKVWWEPFTEQGVTYVQLLGVGLFALTWLWNIPGAIRSESRRFLLLGYAFLWVILFNHASESPTYIIAVQGVTIFYIVNEKMMYPWSTVLICLVFLFSMLAPTDIYPFSWRNYFFQPYLIKVIPCLMIWIVLQLQLALPDAKSNKH
jgi:hypothetical protein